VTDHASAPTRIMTTAQALLLPVVELIKNANSVVVCAGAGISTSCGLPDFRSKDKGLYNNLDPASIGIPSPELLFDLEYFELDPTAFFKFLPTLLTTIPTPPMADPSRPSSSSAHAEAVTSAPVPAAGPLDIRPSPCHYFIKALHEARPGGSDRDPCGTRKLRRVYTLNIDGLEKRAFCSDAGSGVDATAAAAAAIVECHGNLTEFTCLKCRASSSLEQLIAPANTSSDQDLGERNKYELGSVFYCNQAGVQGRGRPSRGSGEAGTYQRPQRSTSGSSTGAGFNRALCNGVLKPNILFFGESFDAHCGSAPDPDSVSDGGRQHRKRSRCAMTISQRVAADVGCAKGCDCILVMGMSFKVVSCIHDVLRLNTLRRARRAPVVYINNQLPSSETIRQLNKFIRKDTDDSVSSGGFPVKKRRGRMSVGITTTVITFPPVDLASGLAVTPSISVSVAVDNIFDYILVGDADFITGQIQRLMPHE
jgi:NAD-dependent SIR2 family protein deacetylase